MLGDVTPFKFTVLAPGNTPGKPSFIATVHIPVQDSSDAPKILAYMRSIQLKQDLMSGEAIVRFPDCGMEVVGGPRPVFQNERDRGSPVVAYEQDFRFTRRI